MQTANTLGFMLYNLARHPEVQEKLYDEIKDYFPREFSPEPTTFDLMPFLKAVVKENFRLI